MASNYDDILDQLRAGGLIIDKPLTVGKMVRCKIEGDREFRGWYILHEVTAGTGDQILIGSFGIWRGNDQGATKLEIKGGKSKFTAEEREAFRARLREDRAKADAIRAAEAAKAAARATAAWRKCTETGESEYLARKAVPGLGVRYSPSGALVIPMQDGAGNIHGLQVIRSRKGAEKDRRHEKEFWPAGLRKKGHFHLTGIPTRILIIAEGYATGASIAAATQLPVAIAFDAGNLAPVAAELHRRYRSAKILICADDDAFARCPHDGCGARIVLVEHPKTCPACAKDHGRANTGVAAASTAALGVSGSFVAPRFADEVSRREKFTARGVKLTDFNDLHASEGLLAVRAQIESTIGELGWNIASAAPNNTTTAGQGDALRPLERIDELLERHALVYGQGGMVFDRLEHCLVANGDVRDLCLTKYLHRAWMEHPLRTIVRKTEVGFDPGCKDQAITCNLWSGWPTQPAKGSCSRIIELARHMCSSESKSADLFDWLMRWCAYPIHHPGAKMKSCVVVCGPQGAGKNMLFEDVLMAIYRDYGRVIDQDAIEDKFNDWASRKLFLIADEVLSRSEVYHVKNKLKRFVTGDTIRINPKNMGAYDERNHVNMVFLSNETMPVLLEEDDRRHAVLRTPPALPQEFYTAVAAEIHNGGVAAFHDYLLNDVDLAGFTEHSRPPWTDAKLELIDLGRDSTSRFFFELSDGEIAGVGAMPCLTVDLYKLYGLWCVRNGYKRAAMNKLMGVIKIKHFVEVATQRYLDTMAIDHQRTVAMLGGLANTECPPGHDRKQWLGKSIAKFASIVEGYADERDGKRSAIA